MAPGSGTERCANTARSTKPIQLESRLAGIRPLISVATPSDMNPGRAATTD
jgi:hypothetical protein